MRNLKKILAMVLALIMSLSLMATAGATDFSDDADIGETYKVAAEVLNGLGVFKGYDNGARFEPQGKITRAEVAAIIYRIATGDVTDEQKDIYSSWGMFPDVQNENWFAGYVNYCANAGYIKGRTDGKFWPNQEVTGYEALAMILRAVGYDKLGEFTGSNWQVNTASVARERNILKNITSGLLGESATREMVAEILFRAILVNKVDYTPAYGYQEGSTTIGYDSLGLEEVTGVIVANEWADLYSSTVLEDGKTNMEVTPGDIRTLDYATEITDIGESKLAYIQGGKVLSMDDSGLNTVYQGGAAVNIASRTAFKQVSGLNETENTEYYVNFGDPDGHHGSDYRIEYQVSFYSQAALDRFTRTYADIVTIAANDPEMSTRAVVLGGQAGTEYRKVIPAGEVITDDDLNIIRGIFFSADNDNANALAPNQPQYWLEGDVYAGTKSTPDAIAGDRDLTNDLSYREFVAKYIIDNASMETWDASENGQWVKIIDNDGDGNAEYAFLTQFWLDQVTSFSTVKEGSIPEYAGLNDEIWEPRYIDNYKPEVNDVVIYTLIDGMANIKLADAQTGVVTTVNFENRTITVDSDPNKVWGQSGIVNMTNLDQVITTMSEKVEYIMYRDEFGYVRAFKLANGDNYGLVTEVYTGRVNAGQVVTNNSYTVELTRGNAEDGTFDSAEYPATGAGVGPFLSSLDLTPNNPGNVTGAMSWVNYRNLLQRAIAHLGSNLTYQNTSAIPSIPSTAMAGGVGNGDEFVYEDASNVATGLLVDNRGDNTYTYSNIAKYILDANDNVTLRTAAEYATNQNGEQVYYDTAYDTTSAATAAATAWHDWNGDGALGTADKVDEPTWIAAHMRVNGSTQAQAKAAFNAALGNTLFRVYDVDYVQLAPNAVVADQRSWNTYPNNSYVYGNNNFYINAVHDTQFYVYVPGANMSSAVDYFVDYDNVYAIPANLIRSVYAVAENTTADRNAEDYWVANVIVIELYSWPEGQTTWDNVGLIYYNPSQTTGDVQSLYALHTGTADPEATIMPTNQGWSRNWQTGDWSYGFYTTSNDQIDGQTVRAAIAPINGAWAAYGIHVGVITRMNELTERGGYIVVDEVVGMTRQPDGSFAARTITTEVGNAPVYAIDNTRAVRLRMSSNANTSNVQVGDMIIYVTGKGNTVKYIVDVTTPTVRVGGRAAVASQAEVWNTPSWLYIEGDALLTSNPASMSYSSVFYKILWDQRQISYTVPFKFYGSSTPDGTAVTLTGDQTSGLAGAGATGTYLASVTVSYANAVKQGVTPWVAPSATSYTMFKWSGSAWLATSYPGVPVTTGATYLVVIDGNYYICNQLAQVVTVADLASNRPDLVHVYKDNGDTYVVIMDTSITLANLQSYLYDAAGLGDPVVSGVDGTGVTASNMNQMINGLVANGGSVKISGVPDANISYGPGSTFAQVSYDPRAVSVTTNTGALAVPNNSWIDMSAGLKVTPLAGYKITAATNTTGGTFPATATQTLTVSGKVTITAVALDEQDRVNAANTALAGMTLNNVALANSLYSATPDANVYKAYCDAVAVAVKADVESQLAAAGYPGIAATVTMNSVGTASTSNIPAPGTANAMTVDIVLNSTSVPTATASTAGVSVSVMIGYAGQNAVETAINAALAAGVNKALLSGVYEPKVEALINAVAGVSDAHATVTIHNGDVATNTMVTINYTYTWNSVTYTTSVNLAVDLS